MEVCGCTVKVDLPLLADVQDISQHLEGMIRPFEPNRTQKEQKVHTMTGNLRMRAILPTGLHNFNGGRINIVVHADSHEHEVMRMVGKLVIMRCGQVRSYCTSLHFACNLNQCSYYEMLDI